MRSALALLSMFCCLQLSAKSTYEKLADVNRCWTEQKDISYAALPSYTERSEKEWIRLHLSLVEQTLRNRDVSNLSAIQKQKRLQCLNYLNAYWHAGNFPQNEDYTYRTPIFIDKHDNFCAVGYLVKASGHEAISRKISAQTNTAYVREMHYPELLAWAKEYGFTADELAWIQPGYPGYKTWYAAAVGKGVDGSVNKLCVDGTGQKLYAGGKFKQADSTITANNIAYVTEASGLYTWHNMGTGVNGTVNAIAEYNNNIFVAGSFDTAGGMPVSNVAYWDGNAWHKAGCTYGYIKDLIVFKGELYACGDFDICAALTEINFAKWNGTNWEQKTMLPGVVNTMAVKDTMLLLGGNFAYNNDTVNILAWNENTWFKKFSNKIYSEVSDIEVYKDTVYALGRKKVNADSSILNKLTGNTWTPVNTWGNFTFFPFSYNVLYADADTIMLGGDFEVSTFNYFQLNCSDISSFINGQYYGNFRWTNVDSAVNTMVSFKNRLIIGGNFKKGDPDDLTWFDVPLNGIAYKQNNGKNGIQTYRTNTYKIKLYPNPAKSAITIENNSGNGTLILKDIKGSAVLQEKINSSKQTIQLPALASGIYTVQVQNAEGQQVIQKLVIQ